MNKIERWIELEIKDTADDNGLWAIYTDGRYVDRFLIGHHTYKMHSQEMQDKGYWLVCYAKEGKRYEQ